MAKMPPVKPASEQAIKSKQAATNYQTVFTYGTPEEFFGEEGEQVSKQASKSASKQPQTIKQLLLTGLQKSSLAKRASKQASKQDAKNYQTALTYRTPKEFLGGEGEQNGKDVAGKIGK